VEHNASLPLYINSAYEFYTSTIFGIKCVFVIAKNNNFKFLEIKKQYELIQQSFNTPIVFVFDNIRYDIVYKLIKYKIPFVNLGRQIFMPFILVDLKQNGKVNNSMINDVKKVNLSPAAEGIVIGEILRQNISGKTGKEIAKLIHESPMTVSRALFELQRHYYCKLVQDGNKKTVTFVDKNRLWQLVRDNFNTPVDRVVFAKGTQGLEKYTVKSGTTALSKLGMLSEDRVTVLAIYKRDYINLIKNSRIKFCNEEDATFIIEVWNRNPHLWSENRAVDPISLYLSTQSNKDERIYIENKKLLKQYGLIIDEKP
ncbi:MAG: hypothetical protein WCJ74_03455, partial [bacterium]